MIETLTNEGSCWDEALGRAVRVAARDQEFSLFHEQAESLVTHVETGGAPFCTHAESRGLSARGGHRGQTLVYRADPVFEDAESLMRVACSGGGVRPATGEPSHRVEAASSRLLGGGDLGLVTGALESLGPQTGGFRARVRSAAFFQRVRLARPRHRVVSDLRSGARIRIDVVRKRGDVTAVASGELVLAGVGGWTRAEVLDLAQSTARRAEERLEARPPRGGRQPVVFAPGTGGVLVHELVGHALEADAMLAGRSWLRKFKEFLARELTIIDDPRRGRAPWAMDDEGVGSRETVLVEAGRVTGWIHNLQTAREIGARPTGHGRCSSYREPVRPRMGCTFMRPGTLQPGEVIAGVGDGIYVRRVESAGVDPLTGVATFVVNDADRIRRGRRIEPLLPHLLRVHGAIALQEDLRIADDLAFDACIGSCHKDGQPLAISVGAPTICIGVAEVVV